MNNMQNKVNKPKIIKFKRGRTIFERMNTLSLCITLGIIAAMIAGCFTLSCFELSDAANISFVALFLVILIANAIFSIMFTAYARVKQAMCDLEHYDFDGGEVGETEVFCCETARYKYTFSSTPFDDGEFSAEIKGNKAAENYFSKFSWERMISVEYLYLPYFIVEVSISEEVFGDYIYCGVDEKRENGMVCVTVSEKAEVNFTPDGAEIAEKVYPYDRLSAVVSANFSKRAYLYVYLIDEEDGLIAAFALGKKIISVLDKHGVKIVDRNVAQFVFNDPKAAFELTARKLNLNKYLKKTEQKIKHKTAN